MRVDDVNAQEYIAKKAEMIAKSAGGPLEGGFVECLFEM